MTLIYPQWKKKSYFTGSTPHNYTKMLPQNFYDMKVQNLITCQGCVCVYLIYLDQYRIKIKALAAMVMNPLASYKARNSN
jgi:hypothetical protein